MSLHMQINDEDLQRSRDKGVAAATKVKLIHLAQC